MKPSFFEGNRLGYTKARMKRVAIVSKPLKTELKRLLPELVEWLRAHDFEPVLDRESARKGCKGSG
jgi:hypothetical protein